MVHEAAVAGTTVPPDEHLPVVVLYVPVVHEIAFAFTKVVGRQKLAVGSKVPLVQEAGVAALNVPGAVQAVFPVFNVPPVQEAGTAAV